MENGFPLFSRDVTLIGGPGELGNNIEEIDKGLALEKLKTEIRVSFDYYHRKFPSKNIQKIFLLSNRDYRSDLEGILADMGLSAQFIDLAKVIRKQIPYSLSFIKGYSSSLSKTIKTKVKVNVLAVKARARPLKEKAGPTEVVSLVKDLRLDYRVVALGLLICIATFGFGIYRTQLLRKELTEVIAMRQKITKVNSQATSEELTKIESEYKTKLSDLDNLIKKQLYLTGPFNVIPKAMPPGVWLKNFKKEEGKAEFVLEGMVYLDDSDKEFRAVNTFLSNLKANPDFAKYFKEINIVSLSRGQFEDLTETSFLISCKSYQGKK